MDKNLQRRFKTKYERKGPCWIWTGAKNSNGWAVFSVNGKARMAHHVAHELFVGPVPPNHNVSRTCAKPLCVRPGHLTLVSRDPEARFWERIDKSSDDHWIWKPARFVFIVHGVSHNPRSYAYELSVGKSIGNEYLYAVCGNKKCVNPEHAGNMEDKFWSRADKADDGCWYWQGATLPAGYPHLTWRGRSKYAHRVAYELSNGPLIPDHRIRQRCGHKNCIRPEHLEQVPAKSAKAE